MNTSHSMDEHRGAASQPCLACDCWLPWEGPAPAALSVHPVPEKGRGNSSGSTEGCWGLLSWQSSATSLGRAPLSMGIPNPPPISESCRATGLIPGKAGRSGNPKWVPWGSQKGQQEGWWAGMEKGICAVQARQENNSCEIMLWLLRLPQRRSLHEVCGQLKTDKSKPGSPSTGDEKLWTDGSNEVSWPRFCTKV